MLRVACFECMDCVSLHMTCTQNENCNNTFKTCRKTALTTLQACLGFMSLISSGVNLMCYTVLSTVCND